MLIDPTPADKPGDLNQLENDLRSAVTLSRTSDEAQKQQAKNTDDSAPNDEDIPVKLRGKSVNDIYKMYRDLESDRGRLANDLGVQRQLTDRLLDLKRADDLARHSPSSRTEIKSDELLDNPTQAIEKVVSQRVKETEEQFMQRLHSLEVSLAQERFTQKHPDYQEFANDPQFLAWVTESQYRQRVANAAVQGDIAASDELLTEYKRQNKTRKPDEKQNVEDARKIGLEGGSSSQKVSSGKIYRRADLIRLRLEKPDVYGDPSFQNEIMLAYAQGRVK